MAKTYALVGTGGRARMFYEAILGPHKDQSRLVALCDTNQVRMDYTNRVIEKEFGGQALPTYKAADFAAMLATRRMISTSMLSRMNRLCRTPSGEIFLTTVARLGRISSSPCCARRMKASRTGCRDTP